MAAFDSDDPRYRVDQNESVYRKQGDAFVFFGKLNCRAADQAIREAEEEASRGAAPLVGFVSSGPRRFAPAPCPMGAVG